MTITIEFEDDITAEEQKFLGEIVQNGIEAALDEWEYKPLRRVVVQTPETSVYNWCFKLEDLNEQ